MSDIRSRVFTFDEKTERACVDRMRDLDEMVAQMKELYPENTWSRGEFLLLFFLDDMGVRLIQIAERGGEL